jgi:hypothetical protein
VSILSSESQTRPIDVEPKWVPAHTTSLRLDPNGLIGGGVPLRVLGRAFSGRPLTWYTWVHGDYADDFIALATETLRAP